MNKSIVQIKLDNDLFIEVNADTELEALKDALRELKILVMRYEPRSY